MLRSMYSGISGMKVNQTKLDVIGNNIANVGTTSFKSSRARFSDMLSQNVSDAMAPSRNQGGVNASQVGLGVQLASIDSVMTQGMMQPTGRSLDVGIDGDGFFMVSKGPAIYDGSLEVNHRPGAHNITSQSLANSNTEIMYSRDGSFILDEQGNLLTGDGFRVMGYSLTNDDSSVEATGKQPNPVGTAGLDFRFGPGSQLNGYKVVLGQVGPGTVTSADVDKAQKLIVVNGDFATPGALTTAQVESAINKGLSSSGISQQVMVSGKPMNIANLSSTGIIGGADSTSPNAVGILGFNIQFSEGSALNGYTFEIGKISDPSISVGIDTGNKKITINGNFLKTGGVKADALKDAINAELQAQKISQQVTNITGNASSLSNIVGKTDASGAEAVAPTFDIYTNGTVSTGDANAVGGYAFTFGPGADLNGYTIKLGNTGAGTATKVDITGTTITINTDLSTGTSDPLLQAHMDKALSDADKKTKITISGTPDPTKINSYVKINTDGKNVSKPKDINIANGLTVGLPEGSKFNNLEIEIVDIRSPQILADVEVDPATGKPTKIKISGDFITPGAVKANDLQNVVNTALQGKGITETVNITGNAKVYTGLTSDEVEGGEELKAPGRVEMGGMSFDMTEGGSLNGYKIQIGKITAGTKTEAKIDSKNKTITINGDFVTAGAINIASVQNALNKALQNEGINQGIKVQGNPLQISGVESDITLGGTPVESMNGDGTINYVDATKDLKSYDGELKTLKIPDKVRIPGTDQELRVKTYTIDKNGVINGVLEDGRVAALGQIAMASFKNPEGLTKMGGNLYSSSVNSGDAIIKSGVGTIYDDNSKGYGNNLQGMLEMSNVDLSEQFTDMIVSTRAFQASGKMITTGDEILQDIINLKR